MTPADPPTVAQLRRLLGAYDKGEETEGGVEYALFRRQLDPTAERLRKGKTTVWFTSSCGSYTLPPVTGTIEISSSAVDIYPLPVGSIDVPAVEALLVNVEPRCIFRDYQRGDFCVNPATRYARFYIDRMAEDFHHCDGHDLTHWRAPQSEELLKRIGGEWPPTVEWYDLHHAPAIRRAQAWIQSAGVR